MINLHRYLLCVIALTFIFAGCDLGTNPIILDGANLDATFWIQSPLPVVTATQSVDLDKVVSDVGDRVDSVTVYNVTIMMDSATSPDLALTATTTINGTSLFTFNQTKVSTFSRERSVFDPQLFAAGFSTDGNGMKKLLALLNPANGSTRQIATVSVSGSSDRSPLSFRFRIKFYTQVYTTTRH